MFSTNTTGEMVSTIISTHNRRELVTRAIDSALAQKCVDMELLVVDDASQDGTLDYLRSKYSNALKILSTSKNSGRAVASNIGFKYCVGTYIALLDDDDYWVDEYKLVKQLDLMSNNPALGVVGTWWAEIGSDGESRQKTPIPPQSRYFLIERLLSGGGVISGSSPLIRRAAWEFVGGMDEQHVKGIDSDLYRRIALAGYDVDVLREVTTIADVAHEYERMTPSNNLKSKRRHLRGHVQVLKKHIVTYLFYPRALARRLAHVVKALLGVLRIMYRELVSR